jgi:1-acyl-sn-glycerol-3-phosphate acyltransferase
MESTSRETMVESDNPPSDHTHKNESAKPTVGSWALFVPELLQFLVWVPARILLKLFVSFRFEGTENLKELGRLKKNGEIGGVVFAANHQSELDPISVRAAMPAVSSYTPLFYVSRGRSFYEGKNMLEKYIYGGRFFRWWGAYPAYSGFKDYRRSLEHHIELLGKNKSMLIFPEGKTTKTGELGEARGGVSFLSWQLGVPVVPVSIGGADNLGGRKGFFFGRRKVKVYFGEPLFSDDLFSGEDLHKEPTYEGYRKVAHTILYYIHKNFTALKGEAEVRAE